MNIRKVSIDIVNMLNEQYELNLKTVDAAAMTDDVANLLADALEAEPSPLHDNTNK